MWSAIKFLVFELQKKTETKIVEIDVSNSYIFQMEHPHMS